MKERRLTLLLLLLSQRPDGFEGVSTACVLTPHLEDGLENEVMQGPLHTEEHARLAMLERECCMLLDMSSPINGLGSSGTLAGLSQRVGVHVREGKFVV